MLDSGSSVALGDLKIASSLLQKVKSLIDLRLELTGEGPGQLAVQMHGGQTVHFEGFNNVSVSNMDFIFASTLQTTAGPTSSSSTTTTTSTTTTAQVSSLVIKFLVSNPFRNRNSGGAGVRDLTLSNVTMRQSVLEKAPVNLILQFADVTHNVVFTNFSMQSLQFASRPSVLEFQYSAEGQEQLVIFGAGK